MRYRKSETAFRARPGEPTDSFYCGCQDQDDGWREDFGYFD